MLFFGRAWMRTKLYYNFGVKMASKQKFGNSDASVELELNFDLDEWSKYFDERLTATFLGEARKTIMHTVRKRFITEKGPNRIPWAKLSQLTLNRRRGKGRILTDTRKLLQSIKGSIYRTELIVSTWFRHAFALQYGYVKRTTPKQALWMWYNLYGKEGHPFRAKKITLPARPFLGFDQYLNKELNNNLRDLIKKSEKLGKYGLK